MRRLKAMGAFSVKSYNQPRRDQRQQIVAAARELDMMVVPEGGSLYMQNMSMILDGHTGIEHTVPVERLYKDALTLWSNSGTGYTPTLVVRPHGASQRCRPIVAPPIPVGHDGSACPPSLPASPARPGAPSP